MKSIVTIIAAVISLNVHAADPTVKAECAAIFHGMSVTAAKINPQVATVARNVKHQLIASAEAQMGVSSTSRWYSNKLNQMTAKVQADRGGDGIIPNELTYCIKVAQSYGMM